MFLRDILLQGTALFVMEVPVRLSQPIFLGLLLRYFNPENEKSVEVPDSPTYMMRIFKYWRHDQSPIQLGEAYFFASGIIFCSLVNVAMIHPCMMAVMHIGMKMRVACCSLIYRKTLRLDLVSLAGPTVGNVVNLMSNDVNRFDLSVLYFHYLWIAPLQMIFFLLIMYKEIEVAAVVGISAILCVIPLQAWFGNRTSRFRLKTGARTDERVRQMNEIIQGMQVIKMYTWEYAFAQQIHELRSLEIQVLKQTSYIRGAILSFIMFTTRLAVFLTVVAIVLRKRTITAERVFVIASFYQILRQTMTLFFPYAIAQIAETNVAITRIKKFLLNDETKVGAITTNHKLRKTSSDSGDSPKVSLTHVSAKIEDEVCLHNVSLTIEGSQLTAVIGKVGSGKSSLLNAILGELEPCLGKVQVKGSVSYASQEPWLFAGSVRQNILFGHEFDRERYFEVIRACALVRDFQLLPDGDQTIVGEKGASLSGGQRARINLARAVYKNADIYLLDDPLSAVDTHVGKQLFDKCITGFLADKIVILVTHQLQFLSEVENVVLMHDGKVEAQGSYQFLGNTGLDFAEFLKNQLAVDAEGEQGQSATKIETIMKDLHIQSTLTINVIDKEGERVYAPKPVAELRTQGSVECYIYKQYFKAGGKCWVIFGVVALFLGAQFFASTGDFFLASWVDVEEIRSRNENVHNSTLILRTLDTDSSIAIYSVIIILTMVVALVRSFVFFTVCMRASINLHDRMFQSIITASMQFFNTNTSGRILNRFSKDLGAIDELLPNAMIDCSQIMLNLLGAAVVVTMVNYYLIIPTLVICVVFFFIRRFYIKTSRSVKRLEGISRSPVFAHLNASMQGLTTVRSNNAEEILTKEFDKLQDDHSSAWFMFIACARAFGYWLDLICAFYIAIIAYSFLIFDNTGSNVGLAITQAIGLTGLFQWGMKQSAELENQMTSVERVLEYINRVEHEPDLKSKPDKEPPSDWPQEGRIEFQNLVLKYKPNDPPVLKNLNFQINPREKIGIVGRTGAGKSSMISALFRLAYFDGAVLVDGVDTNEIGLHDLRRKISIIPQEPVLFSGSLRYNMDPFHNYEDEDIVNALIVVESKAALSEGVDCLKHHVSEGGINISVGERQLICLARAVLRNNKILVLDEATANVDPQTDKFIQTTIRQKFATCTVLTIAHRLHTIMDSDRVLVMDAGNAVEFDHPHILLQNRFGFLTSMVEKTGKAMARNLKDIAKENYELKQKRRDDGAQYQ
ncbi:putative multidrug resistance-associated protein lethal(2)03659-like Protein [Tribolium castaneum]|uniref:Putative multidrug resistance-associated protein lethal(2)03659-like Protein n=1 Tax=Tribolium castaneum TaxID=7070 RepID=D6WMM7_TRICA|nr:putative multidrug resistance-associated protein lethal(2)03659-like Protein [Tribolium castaneum]